VSKRVSLPPHRRRPRGGGLVERIAILAIVAAASAPGPSALAQQPKLGGVLVDGSVIRVRGCGSHFFIVYHEEFALAQQLGGDMVREAELLQLESDQTSFEREGRMTATNLTTGREVDFVIERALMNFSEYNSVAGQVCR
jgi:hypothetical protein